MAMGKGGADILDCYGFNIEDIGSGCKEFKGCLRAWMRRHVALKYLIIK